MSDKINILIVDDEPMYRQLLAHNLESRGYHIDEAEHGAEALQVLGRAPIDVVISDVMMPTMDGLAFLRALRADPRHAELPVLLLTARGTSSDKLEGFRSGADDYVTKPCDIDELLARVHVLARRARVARGVRAMLPMQAQGIGDLYEKVARWEQRFPQLGVIRRDSIVGASPRTLMLLRDVLMNARSRDAVLIVGETGSGKTGVAEALHQLGQRASMPFRVVNCAELAAADPSITLAKLFGYGKNSGIAHVPKEGQRGLLEEADGGTIFLDEVHRLPPAAQGQLLLAVEGRPFHPAVGVGEAKTVDVKFVFATNVDLRAEAEAGRFPHDLYQRIATSAIHVPSLAQRREDIAALAEHFLDECRASESGIDDATFAPSLLRWLVERDYPGNIRELRNLVRGTAMAAGFEQDTVLTLEHVPSVFREAEGSAVAAPANVVVVRPSTPKDDSGGLWNDIELRELVALRGHRFRIIAAEKDLGYSEKSRTLTNHLRGLCFKALAHAGFDVSRAARMIVGRDDDALIDRTIERMQSYLAIVEKHVGADTVETLFNNLQQDYRRYLEDAIRRARQEVNR